MNKFKKIETNLQGMYIIEPLVFEDNRGFFLESYNKDEFEKIGITTNFIQDNHSKSKKGVLRGLHFQVRYSQGKLVRVVKGRILDIVVDIRKDSSTYGKWHGIELSEENKKMLYISKGFAHGFLALEDDTEIEYKCDEFYISQYDSGIIWNDRDIAIDWNFEEYGLKEEEIILSEKDTKHQSFKEYTEKYAGENVLLTGADGQLGQDFQKLFDKLETKYTATDYKELDVTDREKVKEFIDNNNFTMIINCAAYNNVDKAEEESEKCFVLNSYVPKYLAEICKEKNIIFVTYSTDFVFDGEREIPYTEEDIPNPLSIYSKTKLEGEKYSLEYEKSFVIRTSWVFGMGNNNFCKQVINWSKGKDKLRIVDDQISSPTYSKDLAEYSWKLIQTDKYGLYHLSNDGEASKFEQAQYILKKIGWNGILERAKTKDFPLPARRAEYSKLDSSKLEGVINKKIPHWKSGIDRFLEEMKEKGEV
ncbi:dTDP-4-dehydrorhamnose reductase [Fusobacterium sp.]|uniref:dTDP-4-dehydrorhamnose reductase n=1 Tax=Fusobacterium sp. TaxID=68766 RepID=UPI0029018547|nr:dTDP-4-dehydrorhamnose reductase [Fusobacterium sp.]MDU1910879.1 dTDP-4-dehydrorhamnose reductase [Fusobacterium sp.]